ncbi:MAG: prenyltransferase/squalene oxidase repeat-containing protein [Lentisphaeria bacterium]
MNFLRNIFLLFLICGSGFAQESEVKGNVMLIKAKRYSISESMILEVSSAINRGVNFLVDKQGEDGSWLKHPAITALAVLSIANSSEINDEENKKAIEKGLKFIISHVQKDGSIWNKNSKEYPSYSTSVCLVTLAYFNRSEYKETIKNAREFLMNSQFVDDENSASYGGIGYSKSLRPDLSNSQYAFEALYLTEDIDSGDKQAMEKNSKMWERARKFLSRCQNLAETNDQGWVVADEENKGSFIYLPENKESKAGEITVKGGKTTLRGYGSMTYAGLKSMIYARMDKDDIRVKEAYKWAMRNYTLDQNPGMEQQGLFYYLQTFTKTLSIMNNDEIITSEGKKHNWREDLVRKLLSSQRGDGSWFNNEGRWWESMPELVTTYALLSLQQAVGKEINLLQKK